MGVIYKITNPTKKIYVGKTYNLKHRIASHKCASKQGKNLILHNSIRKYGWESHVLEIIEEVHDDLLNEREMYWITELKTYCYENENGMNMTKGGDGQRSTWMHKTELREWFSEKFTGEGNPFYGKKHSEETRKILSEHAKIRNKNKGVRVPQWGAEKGREIVKKAVLCYNQEGYFINEFKSVTEASNVLDLNPTNICAVCNNRISNTGGFIFKYKTDNYQLKIEVGEIKYKTEKRTVLCFINNYIIEYPSSIEASNDLKIPKGTINRASFYNKLKPIRTKHIFIYKDLYEEILKVAS